MKIKLLSDTLENKDFRVDSQFYTKEPYKSPILKYEKIGNLIKSAQYGISISMNEDGIGYPIYRMNEIHNMLCDIDVSKNADITKTELETFKLNERDVVFNRTNSFEWVGRTGLYKKLDERDFVFASYLVRFIPNQKFLLPEYLTAFLNCKYGVNDIKRRARQSINQTNVNPEEVKAIEIPKLSLGFQKKIKHCFDNGFKNQIKSKSLYTQAENLLLEELGLQDFEPSKETINIKSLSESFAVTGRIDAEYYLPKYEQVMNKITSQPYDKLVNLAKITKSIEPGSAYYDEEGMSFMRVADFSKNGLTQPQKFLNNYFVNENRDKIMDLKPKKGTILFSKDGSVGSAYQLRQDFNGITSSAILHLSIKDEKRVIAEYLTLALNSQLVQMQAERDAGGSIILHWRVSEIENVVVPIIDFDKQRKIADLIEQSFSLKKQSEHLLEIAKKSVEIAIEKNEETALHFISSQMK